MLFAHLLIAVITGTAAAVVFMLSGSGVLAALTAYALTGSMTLCIGTAARMIVAKRDTAARSKKISN